MVHGRVRSGRASALRDDPGAFGKTQRRVDRQRERVRANRWGRAKRLLEPGVPREDGRLWHSLSKYREEIGWVLLRAVGVGSFLRGTWLLVYRPEITVFDLLNGTAH